MVRDKFEYLAFTCHSRPCVTYSSFALSSVLMISPQRSVDVLGVQDDSNGMLVCGLTNNSCHGIANMKVHAGPQKANGSAECEVNAQKSYATVYSNEGESVTGISGRH